MGRLGLVGVGGRRWKSLVAPAVFLLAATIAVAVFRSTRHPVTLSSPAPSVTAVTRPASRAPRATRPTSPAPRTYTVRAGDTVAAIVAKTGVSAAKLKELNPGLQPTALFIGQKVRLP